MTTIKYCGDCGHYLPGGKEENCLFAVKWNQRSVCPLQMACQAFIPKEEKANEVFAPIVYKKKRRRRKSYEITK